MTIAITPQDRRAPARLRRIGLLAALGFALAIPGTAMAADDAPVDKDGNKSCTGSDDSASSYYDHGTVLTVVYEDGMAYKWLCDNGVWVLQSRAAPSRTYGTTSGTSSTSGSTSPSYSGTYSGTSTSGSYSR